MCASIPQPKAGHNGQADPHFPFFSDLMYEVIDREVLKKDIETGQVTIMCLNWTICIAHMVIPVIWHGNMVMMATTCVVWWNCMTQCWSNDTVLAYVPFLSSKRREMARVTSQVLSVTGWPRASAWHWCCRTIGLVPCCVTWHVQDSCFYEHLQISCKMLPLVCISHLPYHHRWTWMTMWIPMFFIE